MWEKKDADLFNKFLNKISKMEHKECVHSIMWYQGFFQMLKKKKKTTFCWKWYKFWEDSGYKLKNITCKIFSLLHKVKKLYTYVYWEKLFIFIGMMTLVLL